MASVQSTAQFVAAEQSEFAALLRTLPPEAWSSPSLCSEWSVREVVIHTAAHIHNQQNDPAIISQYASGSEEALVTWLESSPAEPTESDYRARRRFAEIQRGELMVHQQDVRRALGIRRVIPQERVQEVLAFSLQPIGSLGVAFGRERAKGLRLVSTENDWTWGTGKDVSGSLEALLMTTAGRAVALEELDGPGVTVLGDRMRNPPRVLRDLLDYTWSANPVR
ncbi:MAG TPA: maleylpyruvate isomerase family mycothiol-dependent enzyme [Acidimicrobiales bacterium]|jgi:uncharacterized protein (TIGR03083 family)